MSPLLDECILERLHQKNIFTVLDILQESPEKLIQITKLPFKVGINGHTSLFNLLALISGVSKRIFGNATSRLGYVQVFKSYEVIRFRNLYYFSSTIS
jgi:hypothetical protein